MKDLVILVTGWRYMSDSALVRRSLLAAAVGYNGNVVVWHGAQYGADILAAAAAHDIGWAERPFPADWDRYHKAAGPIRNKQMVDALKEYDGPGIVVAFPHVSRSSGTIDCILQAIKAGHPVIVHPLS